MAEPTVVSRLLRALLLGGVAILLMIGAGLLAPLLLKEKSEGRPGPQVTVSTPVTGSAGQLTAPEIIARSPARAHHIQIQSWQTPKGATVLFVASPEIPMLDVRVVFNAGSARDAGTPGLALLTNAMLSEGAGVADVDQIARHFEGLGASLDNGAYRDMAVVSLRTLSDPQYRDPALSLFQDVVAHPTFPQDSLDRLRSQLRMSLEQEKQDPGAQVMKTFFSRLYGDAPYGSPTNGTEESLARLTVSDLRAFHQRHYVSRNLVIALIGAISRSEAEKIARQLDAQLPEGQPAPALPAPAALTAAVEQHLEFPSTQTHILVGGLGVKRGDPDWYPLYVGNEILGGSGFASKLNQVIRQDHGLAYSVYSQFSPMGVAGPFMMNLQTRNEQTAQALQLLDKTLRDFIDKGPTDQELNDAKRNLLNSFPLQTASNSSIVDYLGMIGFYKLPLDYLERYPVEVEQVSADAIRAAFARIVQADKLLTVTVGTRAPTTRPAP